MDLGDIQDIVAISFETEERIFSGLKVENKRYLECQILIPRGDVSEKVSISILEEVVLLLMRT